MGVDGGAVADLVARAYRPPPPSDEEIAAHEARLAATRRREQRRRMGITVAVLVVAIVAGVVAVVAVRRADAAAPAPPPATSVPDPASSFGLLAIPGVIEAGEALGVSAVDADGSSATFTTVDLQRRGPEGWVPVAPLEVRSGIVTAEGPAYPSPCDPGCTELNHYDVSVGDHVIVPSDAEPGDYRVCAAVQDVAACGEFAVR